MDSGTSECPLLLLDKDQHCVCYCYLGAMEGPQESPSIQVKMLFIAAL
jgi:hypothetical protein